MHDPRSSRVTYERNENVAWVRANDQAIYLLPLEITNSAIQPYALNLEASQMWLVLTTPCTAAEIAENLSETFDKTTHLYERVTIIKSMLESLISHDLVRQNETPVSPEPSPPAQPV